MMVEVDDPGVHIQELLSAFLSSESLLTSFLSSCGLMFLLNDVVAARRGDHLLVVDTSQARDLPDRGPVTPELIGVNDLWDVVLTEQPGQESHLSFGVLMPLEEEIEHEATPVHSPP